MQESNLRRPVLETGALPLSEYGMKKPLSCLLGGIQWLKCDISVNDGNF